MSTALSILIPRRELARRVSGGLEVTLYWSAHDGTTSIEVWQPATEETLAFPVDCEQALDAFYHPFAHLPSAEDEVARDPWSTLNAADSNAVRDDESARAREDSNLRPAD